MTAYARPLVDVATLLGIFPEVCVRPRTRNLCIAIDDFSCVLVLIETGGSILEVDVDDRDVIEITGVPLELPAALSAQKDRHRLVVVIHQADPAAFDTVRIRQ